MPNWLKAIIELLLKVFSAPKIVVPLPPTPTVPIDVQPLTPQPEPEKTVPGNPFDMFKITIPALNLLPVTGTDFGNSIMSVPPNQHREDLILDQFKAGNVPDFMRVGVEVTVTENNNTLTYLVLPDVLCVGTDQDYLRTPLNPLTAREVADLFSCVLPTRKIANQIWKAATVKLSPNPNGPPYDATMQSTAKMVSHNAKVQASLAGKTPGELVTGHKKDVVLTKTLQQHPGNVAIYGWFYTNGKPIQDLNPKDHDKLYKDYSHGIRMVSRSMVLNGNAVDFYDILKDASLCSLISDEGNFDATNMYK